MYVCLDVFIYVCKLSVFLSLCMGVIYLVISLFSIVLLYVVACVFI